jgi:O-antigen ligase
MNIGKYQMVRHNNYVDLVEKGNQTDQIFFLSIFIIAITILYNRRRQLYSILHSNSVWVALFLYCLFSLAWSENAVISLKRFIKDSTALLIVLVILTDNRPHELFKSIIRRTGYLLTPLSIAFCKYFPLIGRYQTASWTYIYTGVTTHKNILGVVCLINILILVTDLFAAGNRDKILKGNIKILYSLYLFLNIYLLYLAQSMTSTVCLLLCLAIYFSNFLKKNLTAITIILSTLHLTGLLELLTSSFLTLFFGLVDRDITMSGRTELWTAILQTKFNHLLGTGYSVFWTGDRMRTIIEQFIFVPKQAHNGFLEVYINLGLAGLTILLSSIYFTYKSIRRYWHKNNTYLSFQLSFFATYLIYNMTEATFLFNLSPIWFVFLYIALSEKDYQKIAAT